VFGSEPQRLNRTLNNKLRMDLVSVFVLFCAFFCGIGATLTFFWLAERKALSLVRRQSNSKGLAVQKEQGERFAAAAARAVELMSSPDFKTEDGKPDLKKLLLTLASEFPDVSLKLATSLARGKGIAGLGKVQDLFAAS